MASGLLDAPEAEPLLVPGHERQRLRQHRNEHLRA